MDNPGEAQQPDIPEGQMELMRLAAARNADGSRAVSDAEIMAYKAQGVQRLQAARNADGSRAVSDQEIAGYYGAGSGNTAMQVQTGRNMQRAGQTVAHGPLENFLAGIDVGNIGMAATTVTGGKSSSQPQVDVHGSTFDQIAAATGQAISDLPGTIVGWVGGATAGSTAGGLAGGGAGTAADPAGGEVAAAPGAVIGGLAGGGFGSAAFPQALRETMLAMQNSNDIKTPNDFFHQLGVSMINVGKAGVVGMATSIVGGPAAGVVEKAGGGKLLQVGASMAAATAAGVGTNAALTGHMPTQADWISTAALMLVQHGIMAVGSRAGSVFTPSPETMRVAKNVQELYTRLGITPEQVMAAAKRDPKFAEELFQQDQRGQPATPNFNKEAPQQPEPYKRLLAPGQGAGEEGGVDLNAPPPPTSLETGGAPDIHEHLATGVGNAAGDQERAAEAAERSARALKEEPTPAIGSDHGRLPDGIVNEHVFRALEGSTSTSVSSKGAIGIHQIEPGTARYFGFGAGMDDAHLHAWLENDANNTLVAQSIAAHYQNLYRGDSNASLVAYNAGPAVASRYLTAGPGTGLEAYKDPKAPGGWGYKTVPVERDESSLPLETQKYLAHARFLYGGKSAPQANFANHTEVPPEPGHYPGAHMVTNHRGEQVPLVTLHTQGGASYQVNARFAKNFQGFVNDLEAAGYHIRSIDGYQDRDVAGRPGRPSYHDQGAAIDINGRDNPFIRNKDHGMVGGHVVTDLPKNVQQMAEKWGLGWGGAWATEKDAMHFTMAAEEGGSVVMSRQGVVRGPKEPPQEQAATGGQGGGPPRGGPPAVLEPSEEDANLPHPFEEEPEHSGRSADEIVDDIMGSVGEESRNKAWWDPDQVVYNWYSILNPAEVLDAEAVAKSGTNLDMTKDFMMTDGFRQTFASDSRVQEFVEHGPVDAITLQPRGGIPLQEAPKQVVKNGGDMRTWTAYRLAGRTIALAIRGLKSPIDLQSAIELFTDPEMKKIYAGPTAIMTDGLNGGLHYMWQSGLKSAAQVEAAKTKNPIVVSMRRVAGDKDPPVGVRRGSKGPRDPLYRYEGNEEGTISDPQSADIDNLRMMIRASDMNRAVGQIIGAQKAKAWGKDEVKITQVRSPPSLLATANKIADLLAQGGMTPEEAVEQVGPMLALRAAADSGDPNMIPYFEDGKVQFWKTSDPNVARLMRTLTPQESNFFVNSMQALSKLDRAGVTAWPGFTEGVLMFHQLSAFIRDPLHPAPYATFMNGIFDVLGQTEAYHRARAAGAITSMVDMDKDVLDGAMYRDWDHQGFFDRVVNVFKNPLGAYQAVARAEQAALNVGYFKMATKPGVIRQGLFGQAARTPAKAATMSREAFLDWGDHAALGFANGMARATPFWAIHFKDSRAWFKAFADRPATTASMAMMTLTLPTIANFFANQIADQGLDEKDRYDQIPRYMRDNFIIFPPINGVRFHLRVPPFVATLFHAIPERILEGVIAHDRHAWADFGMNFLNEWTGGVAGNVPAILRAPLEMATNKDFNDFRPLIPDRVAQADGYMQYTPATSEISKKMSRLLGPRHLNLANYSPIMTDHLIDSYFGTTGDELLKLSDVGQGKYGAMQLADLPLIHAFVQRNPTTNVQSVSDFYDDASRIEAAHKDLQLAKQRGNVDEVADARGGPWNQYRRIEHTSGAISKLARYVSGLPSNPTLSPAQKAQYTEQALNLMVHMAKHGEAILATVK